MTRPRVQQDIHKYPFEDPDVTGGLNQDSITICYSVEWPAPYLWNSKRPIDRGKWGPPSWMGSLVEGGRDPSGQMYMRNRYYDPTTGRFTQEDPIGLAGGINLYGFAGGDAVNFSDPYGLNPILAIWGALEIAGTVYDVIDAGRTVQRWRRGEASNLEAGAAVAGAAVGVFTVGAGYGRAGREVARRLPDGPLPDNALVCRGGLCDAGRFTGGKGVTTGADGRLTNVSVNSNPDVSFKELTSTIPNRQVGVTTVGDVRAAGGDVVRSPNANNPHHATMSGITAEKAEQLFTPTVRNPNVP